MKRSKDAAEVRWRNRRNWAWLTHGVSLRPFELCFGHFFGHYSQEPNIHAVFCDMVIAAVERREARRPNHKGRKDASQASRRASQHVMGARNTQRFSALRSPSLARKSERKRGKELNDYGAGRRR